MNARLAGAALVLGLISTGAQSYGNADYDYVFNWAEQRLPQFFSPPNQTSQSLYGFYFRYYPSTGNYVGVNTGTYGTVTDRHAFVLAPHQPLADLGLFSTYANEAMAANGMTASANGTVATGKALVGATVTIKDAKGATKTGTTVSDGSYLINTTGMTGPFLVQVVPGATSTLYSFSADTSAYTTMNVTPLTDLMVRTWYGVQSLSADAAYASVATNAAPAPANVAIIQTALQPMMQLWLDQAQVSTSSFSFISTPFLANGSGEDLVLGETSVNTATGAVSISGNGIAQSSTVSFSSANNAVSISTTTTGNGSTSTSLSSSVIPAGGSQQTAVAGIGRTLANMAATVNSRGSALTASDLLPYLDPNLLNNGESASQYATEIAGDLNGRTVSVAVNQIKSIDTTNNIADVNITITQASNGQSPEAETQEYYFHLMNGQWLFYGNGRVAEISLQAEGRLNGGILAGNGNSNGPAINVDVQAPQGTVSGVTVSGGGIANNITLTLGSTVVRSSGNFDHFIWNSGALSQLVPAGTAFTFTINEANGKSTSTTIDSNVFTTELISLVSPTSDNLAVLNLGSPTTVSWTLPKTYAVASVEFTALAFTGDQSLSSTLECDTNVNVANNATSATFTIPPTCSGMPVKQVDLSIATNGVNGERSYISFGLQ